MTKYKKHLSKIQYEILYTLVKVKSNKDVTNII